MQERVLFKHVQVKFSVKTLVDDWVVVVLIWNWIQCTKKTRCKLQIRWFTNIQATIHQDPFVMLPKKNPSKTIFSIHICGSVVGLRQQEKTASINDEHVITSKRIWKVKVDESKWRTSATTTTLTGNSNSNSMRKIHEKLCRTLSNNGKILTRFDPCAPYCAFIRPLSHITHTQSIIFWFFFFLLYLSVSVMRCWWHALEWVVGRRLWLCGIQTKTYVPTNIKMGNRLCTHDTSYAIYLYLYNQMLVSNMFSSNTQILIQQYHWMYGGRCVCVCAYIHKHKMIFTHARKNESNEKKRSLLAHIQPQYQHHQQPS